MESKQYLVIARKYRPQAFDEMIGQGPIATTLKNAISLNRIGHAYLFTGPRGVGKTSMARIFAKALNCKKGPTVTPCGECPACLEIESARSLDVLEIDGASNRGIDEIRALRENVKFAPAAGKFKVYIIDEVHQITNDGFNALLKTLEEPPAHVKFIFATTSAHKVPATILSRCQRFDFRRISSETIAETLKEICKKEKIKADEDALFAIAKAADGSLRDSQSILDQIAASTDTKITKEDVVRSLGVLEEEKLVELMDALAKKDAAAALWALDASLNEGKDPGLFMEKLLEHVRNLLFLSVSDGLLELIDATESYKKSLLKQKTEFSKEELFYFFSVISHTLQILRRFEMKRIPVEMALLKLAHRAPAQLISEVLDQLKGFQKKNPDAVIPAAPKNYAKPARPAAPVEIAAESGEESDKIEELPSDDLVMEEERTREKKDISLDSVWAPLIGALKAEKISVATYLSEGEPLAVKNGVAKISFPDRLSFHRETLEVPDNKRLIEKHLSILLDQPTRIEFESVKELSGKTYPGLSAEAPKKIDPEADPALKSAMNIFGGKIVRG